MPGRDDELYKLLRTPLGTYSETLLKPLPFRAKTQVSDKFLVVAPFMALGGRLGWNPPPPQRHKWRGYAHPGAVSHIAAKDPPYVVKPLYMPGLHDT